ncbi:hypothetical protein WDU94_009635 [Cyamophila willieti]
MKGALKFFRLKVLQKDLTFSTEGMGITLQVLQKDLTFSTEGMGITLQVLQKDLTFSTEGMGITLQVLQKDLTFSFSTEVILNQSMGLTDDASKVLDNCGLEYHNR